MSRRTRGPSATVVLVSLLLSGDVVTQSVGVDGARPQPCAEHRRLRLRHCARKAASIRAPSGAARANNNNKEKALAAQVRGTGEWELLTWLGGALHIEGRLVHRRRDRPRAHAHPPPHIAQLRLRRGRGFRHLTPALEKKSKGYYKILHYTHTA